MRHSRHVELIDINGDGYADAVIGSSGETIGVEIGEREDWAGGFAFGDGDWSFDVDAFEGHQPPGGYHARSR